MKKCALLFLCIAMLLILAVPGFAETPPTAPTIVTQPVDLSLTYAYTGGNELSVSASAADGYTLSYQWYSNTNASNEGGTPIDGATEARYIVPEGKKAGTTEYYYCVVTAKRTDNDQTAETATNAATVSIGKATPDVTAPTANATYGTCLSDLMLTNPASGTWTWATDNGINPNETAVGTVGTHVFRAKFTPTDTANYCEITKDVTVTVGKATPNLTIEGCIAPYGHPVSVKSNCNSDGKVTYVFYKSDGVTKTKTNTEDGAETEGGAPKNAGTYDIKASVAETSNYLSDEQTLPNGCVITQAPNPAVLRSTVTVKRGSGYDLSGLVSGAKGTVSFALNGSPAGYSLSGSTLTLADDAVSSCTITVMADGTVDGKSNYKTFSGEIIVNATNLLPQDSFGFADVAQEKTYGDGDFIVAATGEETGSNVTYSSSDPAVATVDAATGNVHICKVGEATITATAGETETYASATASYKLTVNRKPVTISGITADDLVYNPATAQHMTLNTNGAVINGKLAQDELTVSAIGACDADVGENKTVTMMMTLGGSSAGNYTLAKEGQQETTTVNILPKPVTVSGITAVNKPYDGTTEATLDYTNVSIKDKEDNPVNLTVTATGVFADKDVGEGKTVTISGLKLVGVDAENYTLAESEQQTTASITAKEVGLIWTNTRLTYTGSPQAPTAQATGVANGDEIGVSVSGAQTDAGTGYTATASALTGDKADNYKLPENKTVTFKISKAIPKVTTLPTASSITYGQTLTDSNLSDGAGSVEGSFAWKDSTVTPVVSDSQTMEYDVVFTPTDTANYYEVERKLKLTVEQKEVGLTWNSTPLTFNGSAQAPTAEATGLVNGDAISVTVSGAQTDAGTGYTATASGLTGAKAGNYKLPAGNTTTFTIAKATHSNQTASGSAKFGTSGTVDLSALIEAGGSLGAVSVTDTDGVLDGAPTLGADNKLTFTFKNEASNKTATVTIPVTGATNYNNYNITVTLTVLSKNGINPTVTLAGWTYGETAKTPSVSGNTGNGTVTYAYKLKNADTYTDTVPTNAGEYTVKATVAETADYGEGEALANFTISKATITITAKSPSIYVGGTVPTLGEDSYTVAGLKSGETLAKKPSINYSATPDNTKAGSYDIIVSGAEAPAGGNYNEIKYVYGKLTINVKPTPMPSGGGSSSGGSSGGGSSSGASSGTTTTTNPDGSKTTTTTNADGSKTAVTTAKDGSTGTVKTDAQGNTVSAEAAPSAQAISEAAAKGEAVTLPVAVKAATSAASAAEVKVTLPANSGGVKVEIPTENLTPGTVAVIVHADGTEEIVKTSTTGDEGVVLTLSGSATVKIVDNTKPMNDVTGDEWYADSVAWATSHEVMNGVGNGEFHADAEASRGQITQLLMNLDGAEAPADLVEFLDVHADDWFAGSVAWAVENGVAQGEGEKFGANDPVSREQLAVMLYNYAQYKGYDVSVSGDVSSFPDAGDVNGYAQQALAWAVGAGLINGTTDAQGNVVLDPQGTATRGQIAAIIERFCEKVAK